MAVSPEKQQELRQRMAALGISEEQLVEKFILGSGKGGQKRQKTSSCVYLFHSSSGIEIKCQANRSREINRFLARRELCTRLEEIRDGKKSERQQVINKIQRQKKRRARRALEKKTPEKKIKNIF